MATDEAAPSRPPLWQIIPLDAHELPAAPAREAAAKGLAALWRLIRRSKHPQTPPQKTDDQLQALAGGTLSRLVPAIDWEPGAAAITDHLSNWPGKGRQDSPIHFFIGPPHGGRLEMLTAMARSGQWPVVKAPSSTQILARDASWLSDWPVADRPWILPGLEDCFLRHADGLDLVRRFFERALSGRLGFGVVGCDSWSWRYLRKIWPMPQVPVYTLQAFDGDRLACYFDTLATSNGNRAVCFREVDNGRDVLRNHAPDEPEDPSASAFLKYLAAQSRGNPGVAVAYWRASLRAGPDDADESKSPAKTDCRETVWVKTGLGEPALPLEPAREIAFILHALLLHHGLAADLLTTVLPLPPDSISAILLQLAAAGIVREDGPAWRVTALGYPAVRRFLKNNGHLTDTF